MRTTALLCTLAVLLCAEAPLRAAFPLSGGPGDSEGGSLPAADAPIVEERDERKVGDLDVTEGPFEYVSRLQSQRAFPDGQPRNPEQDPTNVWYILDKDVNEGSYRRPPESQPKCASVFRFIFSWETMAEEEKALPVQSAVLRTYLQVVPRLLDWKTGTPVEVDVSATVQLLGGNGSTNVSTPAGSFELLVSSSSNEWIELNITEGIQSLWPPNKDQPQVEVTVTLRVNCESQKKVPASLVDPAAIPLSKAKRRQRHMNLQPMLLIFTDDEEVKQRIKQDSVGMKPEADILNSENQTQSVNRAEREASKPCAMENFMITFATIGLPHFRFPVSYNARKCVGTCSHRDLREDPSLGNNYAKIMASAYVASLQSSHTLYEEIPPPPCCVPIRYSPMSVLMQTKTGWRTEVFASMKVEECGCR